MDLKKYFAFVIIILLLLSCASEKDVVYFIQHQTNNNAIIQAPKPTIIESGDLLSIDITALDAEALRPFMNTMSNSEGKEGSSGNQLYSVKIDSSISFPILGNIKLGGYNTIEAEFIIKQQLKKYILRPMVQVRIVNFKVTILGEVKNPGVYVIPEAKINVLELIGMAGDLTIYGKRKDIKLIRIEQGVKRIYNIDLTSDKLFYSSSFFLHKNDIIYVKPNKAQLSRSVSSPLVATVISLVTLTVSMLNLLL